MGASLFLSSLFNPQTPIASSSSSSSFMAASVSSTSDLPDGPVLSLITKRLRALRKKLNRIHQMEESLTLGKPLNKEQEDVLKSKPVVLALIEELDKLRSPLLSALQEELKSMKPVEKDDDDNKVRDLVGLLYFGTLFDVKEPSEFRATMLTRTHERNCCLTYDYVTEEVTELLCEKDLDMISGLGGLVTSRPVSAAVSHKNALERCLEHAKRWMGKSEETIHPGSDVTYAGLREKLSKIMGSDYFTTTPQMKMPEDVAAEMGKYNSGGQQVHVEQVGAVDDAQEEGLNEGAQYEQKDDQGELQCEEVTIDQSSASDETQRDEPNTQIPTENTITDQQDEERVEAELEHEDHQRDPEHKTQNQYNSRRPYQNQRGGRGGGRRGYSNGRGGRGPRGGGDGRGYQNGRGQQYYDSGYYPRNYYNSRGRGGGRSSGPATYSNNNNHGPAPSAAHGGHVAVGANP